MSAVVIAPGDTVYWTRRDKIRTSARVSEVYEEYVIVRINLKTANRNLRIDKDRITGVVKND